MFLLLQSTCQDEFLASPFMRVSTQCFHFLKSSPCNEAISRRNSSGVDTDTSAHDRTVYRQNTEIWFTRSTYSDDDTDMTNAKVDLQFQLQINFAILKIFLRRSVKLSCIIEQCECTCMIGSSCANGIGAFLFSLSDKFQIKSYFLYYKLLSQISGESYGIIDKIADVLKVKCWN